MLMSPFLRGFLLGWFAFGTYAEAQTSSPLEVAESDSEARLLTPELEATVRKRGYVTGVAAKSFVDRKTGFRDVGYGLDIVDWILEPGSDEAYRDQLQGDLHYAFNYSYHGRIAKRTVEGPQICTQANELPIQIVRGPDFIAVKQSFQYTLAAPGKRTGSKWEQTLVFAAGSRYFVSSDKITTVNASAAMFLRIDMPGHIQHTKGDSFSEVYLSYERGAPIPAKEFFEDFAPDERLIYRRAKEMPERFIRAYHLRDPKTGKDGPWLAGMTLEPSAVHEAWCHQRGYVCMIEEIGGRPVEPGDSFSAAFIVGYFDSIEEMHEVYDRHKGNTLVEADEKQWRLIRTR